MKNYIKFNLNEKEFNLICDSQNGNIYNFEDVLWKHNIISGINEAMALEKLHKKWKVKKERLIKKLLSLCDIHFLELLIEVDLFWDKRPEKYSQFGNQTPQEKILEIINSPVKHEPIIWSPEDDFHEFLIVSRGIGHEFIVYIQNSCGQPINACSTREENLLECLLTFSDANCFSRLERLDDAIFSFFDGEQIMTNQDSNQNSEE